MGSVRPALNGRALVTSGLIGLLMTTSAMGAGAQTPTPGGASATPATLAAGQLTSVRSFLVPVAGANITITPLLTSGEMVGDYQFAGTPDGMGAYQDGDNVVLFVNHEWTPKEA